VNVVDILATITAELLAERFKGNLKKSVKKDKKSDRKSRKDKHEEKNKNDRSESSDSKKQTGHNLEILADTVADLATADHLVIGKKGESHGLILILKIREDWHAVGIMIQREKEDALSA
jgi:hypothetical protein